MIQIQPSIDILIIRKQKGSQVDKRVVNCGYVLYILKMYEYIITHIRTLIKMETCFCGGPSSQKTFNSFKVDSFDDSSKSTEDVGPKKKSG